MTRCAAAVLVATAAVTLDAAAQEAGSRCVAVSLDADHWVGDALHRLRALGVAEGYVPSDRGVPLCEAARILEGAAGRSENPAAARLAAGWATRLIEEYPGLAEGEVLTGAAVGAGWIGATGRAAPGGGDLFAPGRLGARELPDLNTPWGSVEVAAALGPLAFRASPRVTGDSIGVAALEAAAVVGPVRATIGRATAGYGALPGGSLVLSSARLDRVELETARPFRLPGPLRYAGPISFSTLFAPLQGERHEPDTYLWAASGSVQPHWRATFSVHRAAMVGGEHAAPLTVRTALNTLIGRVAGLGTENQVVSVEGRFHLPTERVLPLTLYAEWGAEDAAGGWWDVPGRTIGVHAPALPGIPGLAISVERAGFQRTCCFNPMWYRHWAFPGAWAEGDAMLGHRMGGHGVEWSVHTELDQPEWPLRLRSRLFRRERRDDNLFVPGRLGESVGIGAEGRWRLGGRGEIFGAIAVEDGDGWRERHLEVAARVYAR